MSISIFNSQVKVFVYVPPREKCVRPTLCPFRVRTHQVLLRTHVCVCQSPQKITITTVKQSVYRTKA